MTSRFFLAVVFVILLGCNTAPIKTVEQYMKWLDDEHNGLVERKFINGIELKIKYLPADYLVYAEQGKENIDKRTIDSLMTGYKDNISFMLSIGPDERKEKGGDVMLRNVIDYKEYAERTMTMNFDMEKYVSIKTEGKEYRPVLSAMGNTYGLESKRSIVFVFSPKQKSDIDLFQKGNLDFVYTDELFELGTSHFIFKRNDIKNIPAFPFGKN